MRTAIMQPYFLPYLGYFQLIDAVDVFVVYDTIQYTKKGWINRNRFLRNSKAVPFTLPLRKDSDFLDVREREISEEFQPEKLCAQISQSYRKAPEYNTVMPLIEKIVQHDDRNLFGYLFHSIREVSAFLELGTRLRVSSKLEGGAPQESGADRVISLCNKLKTTEYVNLPGGRSLYSAREFAKEDITLKFLEPRLSPYHQFGDVFVPGLSILDVMMFNDRQKIRSHLIKDFALVD